METALFPEEPFTITVGKTTLHIKPLTLTDRWGCHVKFSSDRKDMVVVRATGPKEKHFWTSIPEGRQVEAEGVGKLIEEYLKKEA